MAQRNHPSVLAAWLSVLHRVLRELRRLNRAYAHGEEDTDNLIHFVHEQMQLWAGGAAGGPLPTFVRPVSRRGPKDSRFLLDIAARRGVDKLEILPGPAGAVSVRIDGGRLFPLPRTLAVFLKAIVQDAGREDGDLVGWKSLEDLQRQLAAGLGHPFDKHNVEQLVYRLRRTIRLEGAANPRLVMSHPEWGWRFAVRKKPRL